MARTSSFYIKFPAKVFLCVWAGIFILIVILGAGPFFVPYLPSIAERKRMLLWLPIFIFFLLLLPVWFSKLAIKLDWVSKTEHGNINVPKFLLGAAFFSALLGWGCSGLFAFPTVMLGNSSIQAEEGAIYSISGFRGTYSAKSWISFEDGWLPRRFIWPTSDILMKSLAAGDCVEITGKTLGLGIYIERVTKISCNRKIM